MTFPGGAPGGYPGQGPQQHQPGPYGPPPGGGMKLGIPAIAHLATAGLGVINFFLGFANMSSVGDGQYSSSIGFFEAGSAVPALFLIGGLLSLVAILPGENKKPGIAPAALSLAAWLTILFITFQGDAGIGTILMLIFGILQAAAAGAGFGFDSGLIKPPAPKPNYGQPGGMYPPSGQFPAPPPGQPGQPQQPGQFGAPPGQQTTFAPQQGQFGQQPGQPGTPPGGYPQQG